MLQYTIVQNYLEKRAYDLLLSTVGSYKPSKWKPKAIYTSWCSKVDELNCLYLSEIGCPYHFTVDFKKDIVQCSWRIKDVRSDLWFGFSCAWDLNLLRRSCLV